MPLETRTVPALALDPDDVHEEYDRRGFAALSDTQLFERAAIAVAQPKDAANSFILHAPLELMARRLLLPHAAPRLRRAARERVLWVAATYEHAGVPKTLVPEVAFDAPADARDALLHALVAGEVDDVDAIATWLLAHARLDDVM